MWEENRFLQDTAQRFIDAANDQIAIAIIEKINTVIDLDSIIAADLENRKAQYEETKSKLLADNGKEVADQLIEPTIEFKDITSKLTYAFQALLHAGYTFTQDVLGNGEVVIKFFKLEHTFRYMLTTKYSASIKEKI